MADFCKSCNAKLGGMFGKVSSYDDPEMCVDCFGEMQAKLDEARNKVEKKAQVEKAAELETRIMDMRISTAFAIAGRDVEQELDVITAECAFGMNMFRDLFAGVRDLVGGRSVATQKVLRDARQTCLTELKKEAAAIGADAIIGVDLDYQEFSGAGSRCYSWLRLEQQLR